MIIGRVEILDLLDEIKDNMLRGWVFKVLEGIDAKFYRCAGSTNRHHYWQGGLAEHTWSVATLSGKIADHYISMGLKINRDVCVAGGILQDIGKIFCYEPEPGTITVVVHPGNGDVSVDSKYRKTWKDKHFHHIPIGFHMALKVAEELGIQDNEQVMHCLHIIISHHGKKDWSSNQEPQSIEAIIGHHADYLDSYMNANKETKELKAGGTGYKEN